jgi:hypothetical protein
MASGDTFGLHFDTHIAISDIWLKRVFCPQKSKKSNNPPDASRIEKKVKDGDIHISIVSIDIISIGGHFDTHHAISVDHFNFVFVWKSKKSNKPPDASRIEKKWKVESGKWKVESRK